MKRKWVFYFVFINLGLLYFAYRAFSSGDSFAGFARLGGIIFVNGLMITTHRMEQNGRAGVKSQGQK
jgi:hypothetical protein